MTRWALGLLLVCTVPADAVAQPAAPASQTDGAVVVQFRPPVGKGLRYQVEASGKAVQQLSLRFERIGDGFLMHAADEVPDANGKGVIDAALAQPVTFTVDAQGKVTGIVDENAYWRRVSGSLQSSKAPTDARARASQFFETVRTMSSEQRAAVASRDYRAVLRGIGTHRPFRSHGAGLVPMTMDVTQTADTVTVAARTEGGPVNMADFVDFLRASGAPYDGPARPDARFEIVYTIVVDRKTGLLLHSDLAESRVIAGKATRRSTTIEPIPEND